MASNEEKEFYDIVLLGSVGQGKSALGNKLLDLESTDNSKIHVLSTASNSTDKMKRFIQADDINRSGEAQKVTEECKLMSNEDTGVRVLDVPGFTDPNALQQMKLTIHQGNIEIIHRMVRVQIESELKVRRVVYFLPTRGPLEKVNGTMMEELAVMHQYFGKEIFNCMVVIATNSPKEKRQNVGFDEDEIETTKAVFCGALKGVVGDSEIACPPVLYITLNDNPKEALCKIQSAPVLVEEALRPIFKDVTCEKCSVKVRTNKESEGVFVVTPDGTKIPYAESKCHPYLVGYSELKKIGGGFGHIGSLGIGLLVGAARGRPEWPGFTNTQQWCIACERDPGSEGCNTVERFITINKRRVSVQHAYTS